MMRLHGSRDVLRARKLFEEVDICYQNVLRIAVCKRMIFTNASDFDLHLAITLHFRYRARRIKRDRKK